MAGVGANVAAHLEILREALRIPIFNLMAILALRWSCGGRGWPTSLSSVCLPLPSRPGASLIDHVVLVTLLVLSLIVLTRLGLLAMLVMVLFSDWPNIPLTADPSSWFFPSSVVTMVVFAAVGVYGSWSRLAGSGC